MKKLAITLTAVTVALFANPTAIDTAKQSMKKLGGALQGELREKMKEDSSGLLAVNYCADEAQKITQKVSKELGENVEIRRTALKYRNEANEPSIQDIEIMRQMRQAIEEKGADADTMIQVVEGENTTYVYKPLTVGNACYRCHGATSDMDSNLLEAINQKFPYDKAVNFAKGDFRGAIVTEIKK